MTRLRLVRATPDAVTQALKLPAASLLPPPESPELTALLDWQGTAEPRPGAEELFRVDGRYLPCWLPDDVDPNDNWLLSPENYPVYFRLHQKLTSPERRVRMLEIGVRTGYQGVTFARGARGPAFYLGVDPNLYLPDGLRRASETFRALCGHRVDFDFVLLEGCSWDRVVQKALERSGRFDLIHIDGDHTLRGKLFDLELARRLVAPGGLVLADDYDSHASVADALRRAFALGWFQEFAFIPTFRGLAVLR